MTIKGFCVDPSGATYGSREWFETLYRRSDVDPWGLDWRPSQARRYQTMVELVLFCLRERATTLGPVRVLDVGCGTGAFTEMLACSLPAQSEVVGIDWSGQAIERARARRGTASFRVLAATSDDWGVDASFDAITCLEVLYYLDMENRSALLHHVRRGLIPGGVAVFSSVLGPRPHLSERDLAAAVAKALPVESTGTLPLGPYMLFERAALTWERTADRLPAIVGRPTLRVGRKLASTAAANIGRVATVMPGSLVASHAFVLARAPAGSARRRPCVA